MAKLAQEKLTSIVNKYPSHRNDNLNGCWKYMQGRRKDDEAEGLWRVHDKLYDLTDFIDRHPGGRQWLILTKVSATEKLRKV
jgi:Cytochrome b5-like Heme/Steroid binding domain